jgi:hypothetical protein
MERRQPANACGAFGELLGAYLFEQTRDRDVLANVYDDRVAAQVEVRLRNPEDR